MGMNFRDPDELYPETYPGEGGLPGLLRAVMRQQSQQQEANFGPAPNSGPADGSDSPRGGLLGRLLKLQAEQSQQQPIPLNSEQPPSAPQNPNFRRVSRAAIAIRPLGVIGPSNLSGDQSSPSYSPVGDSSSLASMSATRQGTGLFGGYSDKPVSPWVGGSPTMTAVPVGWRVNGIPFPPIGPMPRPQIPAPAISELWQQAQEALKLYSQLRYGRVGGRKKNDDEYCYSREDAEKGRCYARKQEYAHWDHLAGCLNRAMTRRDLCVRNGGPDPGEPREWGPDDDEEIWINTDR